MNDSQDLVNEDELMDGGPDVSTLDGDDTSTEGDEWTGPRCQKCDAPLKSDVVTICRSCGWYDSLGTFVELDPNWEAEAGKTAPAHMPQKATLRTLLKLIPRWGWLVIGSALAVVVESVVVRLVTPSGSSLRTIWSLTQILIGALAVACCHVFNFLSIAADDADVGILDLLLKPFRLWVRTCRNLPKRIWLFNTLVCGLFGVVMAFLVIGGIPYERFWDWGLTEPPKQNLMGAIMDRMEDVESANEDESLEDAVEDFAGKDGEQTDDEPKAEEEKPRGHTDCVILGYQLDREGRLEALFLGTAYRSKLAYAGRVKPKLSDSEIEDLVGALKSIAVKQSIISIPVENAVSVKPKFTCRVTFSEQTRDGHLREPEWDKFLSSMNTPIEPPRTSDGGGKKTSKGNKPAKKRTTPKR